MQKAAAAATGTADLPLENSTWKNLFEYDDRPTILLQITSEGSRSLIINRSQSNQAAILLNLSPAKLYSITKLFPFFENAWDKGISRTLTFEETPWTLRSIGEDWWVLQCQQANLSEQEDVYTSDNVRINEHHIPLQPHESNQSRSASVSETTAMLLDWTRFPIPGLSTWIDLIRNFDWGSTDVGPIDSWSMGLRSYVVSIMNNPSPRMLLWGPNHTVIYNEPCLPLIGPNHPQCLGRPATEDWAHVWPDIWSFVSKAYDGKATKVDQHRLTTRRNGRYPEETFWDITMLPILGVEGHVIGTLNEFSESTKQVRGDRRRTAIMRMSESIATATTLEELWSNFLNALGRSPADVPFAVLYSVLEDDTRDVRSQSSLASSASAHASTYKCVLEGHVNLPQNIESDIPKTFLLTSDNHDSNSISGCCARVWKSGLYDMMTTEEGTFPPTLATGAERDDGNTAPQVAIAAPVKSAMGQDTLGIIICGLNPYCPFDSEYRLFMTVVVDLLAKSASLISLPEEQRRAQKAADDINSSLMQQLRMCALQAERTEAKFIRMSNLSPVGMFVFDVEGRPLYLNEMYLEMIGDTRETASQRFPSESAWRDQIHEDDLERFITAWDEILEKKVPMTLEYRLKKQWVSVDKSSGQETTGERWLLANAFPEFEADGKVSTVQGWLTDISHRKFTETLLSRRLEDALEDKHRTERFIDMTSHEMRNPLSAILQSADSLLSALSAEDDEFSSPDMPVNKETREELVDAAQTIILCAQHQKRIVDDILTLSKLDSSLVELSPDRVQPPTVVRKALKMYEAECFRADIEATMHIEPSYDELLVDYVILDSSRLLQVIINLLTNAIKFTQHANIKKIDVLLGASLEKPTGKHHGVDFIPTKHAESAHAHIAEWGDGEDIYLQFAVRDTGHGLNDEDMKTLFKRFSQVSPRTYKQYGGSGLGLFISRELCELQGGQIGVSSTGGTTTFTFFVKAKRCHPDADALHPDPVSLSRCSSISASPMAYREGGSELLTSASSPTFPNGADTSAQVTGQHSTLTRLIQQTRSRHSPHIHNKHNSADLHVLIVEDNLINQKVLSNQLRRAGCTVHVANHGLECLSFLETTHFYNTQTVPLSIILLDWEMPEMDGLTTIRLIRERQRQGIINGHVPVISVTANARSEQIAMAIEAGMDRVITKPYRIPEILPQMQSLVKQVAASMVHV